MKFKYILLIVLLWFCHDGFSMDPARIWDIPALKQTPKAQWEPIREKTVRDEQGHEFVIQTRKVFYEGTVYQGNTTRVMAFYSQPKGEGPFPGIVLVHGGGGTAFSFWTQLWAKRGYAAIAMDLAGKEVLDDENTEQRIHNTRRLQDGGPDQGALEKFHDFDPEKGEFRDLWTWQSIAAIMKAHSLLVSLPCVDAKRTAATGISWGGYLTTMLAGIDDRFQVIVPVYGCGNIFEGGWKYSGESSHLKNRLRWIEYCDPNSYVGKANCRMLFLDGTDDVCYPLDINRSSWEMVPNADVRLQVNMCHSHTCGWNPKEIGVYIDSVLKNGIPLPCLGNITIKQTEKGLEVSAPVKYSAKPVSARLVYTIDPGGYDDNSHKWKNRQWNYIPAVIVHGTVLGILPKKVNQRPVRLYLDATDDSGNMASTHFICVPAPSK